MEITQEEIRDEIKRMQREYKKAWRRKNPERSRELDRASVERRAARNIMKRRESEQSDAGNE